LKNCGEIWKKKLKEKWEMRERLEAKSAHL
jgi:hypothetical protein